LTDIFPDDSAYRQWQIIRKRTLVRWEDQTLAEEIGRTRGCVLPTPGKREDYFDLVLFTELLTVFIRVKRSITNISDPTEILTMYRREIIRIRKVSLTGVVARELSSPVAPGELAVLPDSC